MPKLIEEDIRYTTRSDLVYGFSSEDYQTRPTMSGYDFSMLLDQLNNFILKHISHSPKILIFATCGTVSWLAKHVEEINTQWDYTSELVYKTKPNVLLDICLDPNHYTQKVVSELSGLSCVREIHKTSKLNFFDFDLVVLCPAKYVTDAYNSFKSAVTTIPVLAYDPQLKLKHGGKHFLHSSIWLKSEIGCD